GTSARTGRVTAKIDEMTIKTKQRDNAVITMLNLTLHQYESTRTRCPFVKIEFMRESRFGRRARAFVHGCFLCFEDFWPQNCPTQRSAARIRLLRICLSENRSEERRVGKECRSWWWMGGRNKKVLDEV